ncbi:hypothetical protein CROQUDRAFT_25214, partial [Cronartium quercuum f. sp. fusiforme G11]
SAGSNFTREQHRYASSVLKNLKKNRYSAPFMFPVDVVKLQIPDYPTIIKNPMDLNTVETRLGKSSQPSYYKSAEQFMADVQLIFTNCYTYNGPPDVAPISRMALDLSLQFDSQIKNLPMAHPSPHLSSRSPSLAKPKGKSTTALAPVMIPNTKEELKFCKDLLREVNKKTHEKFVWPFYEPVGQLGIPEYFKVVKKPMDLSTIKSKLDKHEYKTGTAFGADFRLMLTNCFQFNPIGTPVYNLGKQLEALFEQKWHERPP